MRRPLSVGVFATLAASLGACTALLGDFSVGVTGGPGADGGADVTISSEGGPDATPDAGPDAAPPLLKCVVNGSPVTLLTNAPGTTSERLGVHAFKVQNNAKRRIMWISNGLTNVNFATIDENLTALSIVNQSFDLVASPQALASYDGGFAAIGLSSKITTHLRALRLDDGAVNATDSVDITGGNILPPGVSDLSIAAAPVGGDDFFVVFSFSTGPNVWSMYAGRARIANGANPGAFKEVSNNLKARPSLNSDLLVIDKPDNRAILFVGPDQGQGATMVVQMDLTSGAPIGTPQPLPALHGTSSFEPLAAQTDVAPGGVIDRVGLAFLEYDLNTPNAPFFVYAAAFPAAGLGAFKASALPPPVSFTSAGDVAVDKGRSFWTHYPVAGSHVVEAARATQSGKGVNFLWLDGAGNLRGKASGADALVAGDVVMGAAGTMVSAPNTVLANAAITWLTDSGALRIANIGCKQ